MIISASYRSDIPAFHAAWFRARLAAGWCETRNPYNGRVTRVELGKPQAAAFVFWTRNARSFHPALEALAARGSPFLLTYSILNYPNAIDTHLQPAARAVADFRALAARFGPAALVWRYDPILLSPATEADWHRRNFAGLARALAGATDEVVVSFATLYRKSARSLAKAGIAWREANLDEQAALVADLAATAAALGMSLTLCAQPDLAALSGLPAARCIDAMRLSRIAGRPLAAAEKGNRPGCRCAAAVDIGAYDSCAHGCRYCYAVGDHARVRAALKPSG